MATDDKPLPITSSHEPEFTLEQVALFRAVLQHMNQRRVPYVVSGAAALRHHTGIARNTKDLDLFLPAEFMTSALQSLREAGFVTEVTDPVWLAKAHRGEYYVDLITGMSNAVIVVDMSWIERGVQHQLFGATVKVLAAEELIASKVFVTRRERFDGADVVHIIYGTQGRLDWDRLLTLLGEHWEMLLWSLVLYHYVYPAHAEYVPQGVWKCLLARLQALLQRPPARARFRGSLIDPCLFHIDVAEWGLPNLLEEHRAERLGRLRDPQDEELAA